MVIETPQSAIGDATIGQAIGHHIVRRKLGEGGMGSVHVAEHPAIGKRVALRLLHPEFSSQPEIVSRFLTRAQLAVELRSVALWTLGAIAAAWDSCKLATATKASTPTSSKSAPSSA